MNGPMVNSAVLSLAACLLVACQADDRQTMVGTLERDRIELAVESSEPISRIHVVDGQRLEAGAPVLEQDPARHEVRLQQQVGLRDQATARLAELVRGPRQERISEARARLEGSVAQSVRTEADFHRAVELFEKGVGQQSSVDRGNALHEAAVATEKVDRETLQRLLNGTTTEELQQAQAQLDAAEAAVRQARLDLQRLIITAPLTGVVDKVWFETGERPAPGTTVAVMLDTSRAFARIYVPAHQRTSIQAGVALKVALDGHEGVLEGTVSWVSSDASFTPYFALTEHDRSRLSYLAEIDLPEASELPSGLPLEAWLPGE